MSLDSRLKAVFADTFETTPDLIHDDISVDNAPATWDSMRSIVLASSLEAEFDIDFSDSELVTLDNLRDIRECLLKKGVAP